MDDTPATPPSTSALGYISRRHRHPAHDRPPRRNLGYGGNQKAGLPLGHRPRLRHRGAAARRRAVRAREACPTSSRRSSSAAKADAVFGSRMMRPGRRPRAAACRCTSTSATASSPASRTPSPALDLSEWHSGYRAYRVSRSPTLPVRRQHRRLRLRHRDHPAAASSAGTADRRGPDPDLLRRRDLLRQRHGVRPRHRDRHASATASARSASAGATLGHDDRAVRRTSRRPTARTAVVLRADARRRAGRGCSTSAARTAGSPPSCAGRGHHVTGVDLDADEGVRERVDRFFEADLEQGLPDAVGGGYDVVIAADVLEHVRDPERLLAELADRLAAGGIDRRQRPELRPLVPARADGGGPVRLRPARHPRPRRTSASSRGAASGGRSPTPVSSPPRSATPGSRSTSSGSEECAGPAVAFADRLLRTVWPTMFAYQFVVRLETAPALLDPS